MNQKTILGLIVLCGVFAFFGLQDVGSKKGKSVLINTTPLKTLSLNKISRISITKDKKEFILEKSATGWIAKIDALKFPVDFLKLKTFLLSIKNISLIDKKTSSDKHDARFGLDKKSNPTFVNLSIGDKSSTSLTLGNIRKGKSSGGMFSYAPDEGHYLKIGNSKDVYLSKEKIDIQMSYDFWLNKKLIEIKKEDITEVSFIYPYKKTSFHKTITQIQQSTDASSIPEQVITWQAKGDLPEGKTLDTSAMNDFLNDLETITVSEPANTSLLPKLKNTEFYSLTVKSSNKTLYQLNIGEISGSWYVYKASEPTQLYKISTNKVEDLFNNSAKFFKLTEQEILKDIDSVTFDSALSVIKKENAWKLNGTSPSPNVKESALTDLKDTLAHLGLKDYHTLQAEAIEILNVKGDDKEIVIFYIGDLKLGSKKIVTISGLKGAFSISESDYRNLFLAQKNILSLENKIESVDDLNAINFSSFSVEKKGDDYRVGAEKVEKNRVSDWLTSLKNIFDSPYYSKTENFKIESTLTLKDKNNKTYTLKIGKPTQGISIVQYSQFGGIFSVRLEVIKSLLKGKGFFLATSEAKK